MSGPLQVAVIDDGDLFPSWKVKCGRDMVVQYSLLIGSSIFC